MATSATVFIVAAPSGAGKTSLVNALLASTPDIEASVSHTTREPRPGEIDGKDYFFVNRETFERLAAEKVFLEHAEVHGQLYGTLKSEIMDRLRSGQDVLVDIDVQGAELIRRHRNETIAAAMIDIFILPPDGDELVERLRGRGTETAEQLELRLHNAREEMRHWEDYQYTILSASKEEDFTTFSTIVNGERCRTSRYLSDQ